MNDNIKQRALSAYAGIQSVIIDSADGELTSDDVLAKLALAKDDLANAIREAKKQRDDEVLLRNYTQTVLRLQVEEER